MKASAGTMRVIGITPAGDAFGCTTITRMPGQTCPDVHRGSLCTRVHRATQPTDAYTHWVGGEGDTEGRDEEKRREG